MKAIGIRELKNRLSEYVREVRSGEEIQVTHRGEVVAELRPPSTIAPRMGFIPVFASCSDAVRPGGSWRTIRRSTHGWSGRCRA
jgi:hypothetical protein